MLKSIKSSQNSYFNVKNTRIVNLIIQMNAVILRCFRRFYHLEGGVLKLIVLFLKN